MLIMIRYGEIGLKSDQVRRKFEEKLIHNIKERSEEFGYRVFRENRRIFVKTEEDKVVDVVFELKKISGIVSVSPCIRSKVEKDFEDIYLKVKGIIEDYIRDDSHEIETFGIRARRVGSHKFTSKEVEKKIGERVLNDFELEVNLDNPDLWVYIEIRNKKAYVFTDKIKCMGGIPLGIEGEIMALIEDRASVVAAYLMMKRGCRIFPIYVGLNPNEVSEGINVLKKYQPDIKLFELRDSQIKNREKKIERVSKISRKLGLNALAVGNTVEELENKVKDSDITILYPNCGFSEEEVLMKYSEISVG